MTYQRAFLSASLLILLASSLTACTREAPVAEVAIGAGAAVPFSGDRLVSLPRPPILAATDSETLTMARMNAERTSWEDLYQRREAQLVSVEALPFLQRSAEGRRFLAATGNRVIARGMPAEMCPATAVEIRPQPTSLETLVGQALSRCLDRLRPRHPDCGCRVVAVNDFLTVPREEMSYASGTTARLRVPALGLDEVLVAEDDGEMTLIRGLAGPVARIARLPGEGVRIDLVRQGRSFEGRSIPVGYRRGRIAERMYATDPSGARMSLLIGFSPDELAERAAAWLAWPTQG